MILGTSSIDPIFLSGTIIVCSSVMMGVACLWYSSMESKYENEENKHEHKTGERKVFRIQLKYQKLKFKNKKVP